MPLLGGRLDIGFGWYQFTVWEWSSFPHTVWSYPSESYPHSCSYNQVSWTRFINSQRLWSYSTLRFWVVSSLSRACCFPFSTFSSSGRFPLVSLPRVRSSAFTVMRGSSDAGCPCRGWRAGSSWIRISGSRPLALCICLVSICPFKIITACTLPLTSLSIVSISTSTSYATGSLTLSIVLIFSRLTYPAVFFTAPSLLPSPFAPS